MFLCDCVEFSRAYDRWLAKQKDPKYDDRKNIVNKLRSDHYNAANRNMLRDLTGGQSRRWYEDFNRKYDNGSYSDNLTEKQLFNKKRRNNIRRMEEKINVLHDKNTPKLIIPVVDEVKQTKKTSINNTSNSAKSSGKKSSKLLKKYTLGGLGIIGTGAATYGGYKLLTRNKNKKDK